MKIYSFEFGVRPVEWCVNDFKGMRFIGTRSRRFPGNMNFLRIDTNENDSKEITFQSSTYYNHAIYIEGDFYVSNQSIDMNCRLFESNPDKSKCDLAFVIIDSDAYRLIDYHVWIDDDEEMESELPEIRKVVNMKEVRVGIVQFNYRARKNGIVDFILYNRLTRRYEYWRISADNEHEKLQCVDITDDLDENIIIEWIKADQEAGYQTGNIGMNMNHPSTSVYVTTSDQYYDFCGVLKRNPSVVREPHIILVPESNLHQPDSFEIFISNSINAICDIKQNVEAITFYGIKTDLIRESGICLYNFIMDETGNIMTI